MDLDYEFGIELLANVPINRSNESLYINVPVNELIPDPTHKLALNTYAYYIKELRLRKIRYVCLERLHTAIWSPFDRPKLERGIDLIIYSPAPLIEQCLLTLLQYAADQHVNSVHFLLIDNKGPNQIPPCSFPDTISQMNAGRQQILDDKNTYKRVLRSCFNAKEYEYVSDDVIDLFKRSTWHMLNNRGQMVI